MLGMLIAYDAAGDVIATCDYMTSYDAEGNAVGLVDFEAHELAGGELTDIWRVEGAAGSKTWPEWIGGQAHDFRVELKGPSGRKRAVTLVHKATGERRERATIEAAIADRIASAAPYGVPANITDIVGRPDRPLRLDDDDGGPGAGPDLPIVRVR